MQRPAPAVIVLVLATLLGLQPVTTDLYLPALPTLQADLGSSMGRTQLTLSALLLAFGISQLFVGALADRYGRRPLLLLGLGLYFAATLASVGAPAIDVLIACRAAQGVGMAAAIVCARAMVRDLYEPQEGARVMARALTGLGVVALTGPIAGALLVSQWGWRATFAACCVYAAMALVLVSRVMPETLRQANPQATQLRPLLRAWQGMARNSSFMTWVLLTSFTYGAVYAFLAGSSFLFINIMGVSRLGYSLAITGVTLVYVVGTLVCHRSLARQGMQKTVQRAAFVTATGALAMVLMVALGWHPPWAVCAASMCIAFGHAHHQSCGQVALLAPFAGQAGTASALAGFISSALAFGIGASLGWTMNGTAAPVLLTQATLAGLTAAVAWTWVPRHGHSAASAPSKLPAAQG